MYVSATAVCEPEETQTKHLCFSAESSSEPEKVDAATVAEQQLLMKAAPLAGMWAAERFGLADVQVLKLLEALPGMVQRSNTSSWCCCAIWTLPSLRNRHRVNLQVTKNVWCVQLKG